MNFVVNFLLDVIDALSMYSMILYVCSMCLFYNRRHVLCLCFGLFFFSQLYILIIDNDFTDLHNHL